MIVGFRKEPAAGGIVPVTKHSVSRDFMSRKNNNINKLCHFRHMVGTSSGMDENALIHGRVPEKERPPCPRRRASG
jgi:hypothetical protein